ncbi:NAD(P)-dependent alcohol dehydrogenase [Actinocrispum sp. NPDC049592]|uniref:NAD(P)-dependent alcohol dehydrogenase n=1 Tax=Actinocrispum sp. NPDC049592 TaxID=3154835 RepID=UPI003447F8D7
MKAVYQDRYGLSDVLRFKDVDHPTVGEREVLVRVTAAGMDPGVWHLMTGMPYAVRLMGYGFRAPKDRIRGRDLAGVVEAVGAKVTKFKAGDEVFGVAEGTFAEYVSAKETALARKPANLTFEQAAALAISAFTAVQALRKAGVRSGHKVLVIGAAGGVGTFAVQLAKHHGAHVIGVCSTSKVDFVHGLGADDVIDYTREDLTGEHDIILDCAGNRSLTKLRRVLKPNGTLVLVGGERGGGILGGMDRVVRASLLSLFISQNLRGIFAVESPEDLELIRDLAEQGAITPAIDRTYPLNAVPEAIDHVQKGRVRGKVVITV